MLCYANIYVAGKSFDMFFLPSIYDNPHAFIDMPLLILDKDECLDYCSISNENITMTVPLQMFFSSVNQRTQNNKVAIKFTFSYFTFSSHLVHIYFMTQWGRGWDIRFIDATVREVEPSEYLQKKCKWTNSITIVHGNVQTYLIRAAKGLSHSIPINAYTKCIL